MPYIAPQITQIPVGDSVPSFLPHAVSVSLPTWRDNVAYEEGEAWIKAAMTTGYPRFFIHKLIQKLAGICEAKFGERDESCLLMPSQTTAELCRDFLVSQKSTLKPRIVEWSISPSVSLEKSASAAVELCSVDLLDLQIVFFPSEDFGIAKAFWQHSGCGISSRFAERCLTLLGETGVDAPAPSENSTSTPAEPVPSAPAITLPALGFRPSAYSRNKHYARSATATPSLPPTPHIPAIPTPPITTPVLPKEDFSEDHQAYVELRYGRNLPSSAALTAKTALKRRIAGVLEDDKGNKLDGIPGEEGRISPDDVYLFPRGMNAIFNAHQLAMKTRGKSQVGKSICFGFPYVDTLKIIEKWGPGAHFYGHGSAQDLKDLETLLSNAPAGEPPVLALFCEFPTNPLLRSPDLITLRRLADQYGFYIVVDETIGNFVNVDTLRFADILVSSLTKVFSGDPNVMGGSLVLNPAGQHYSLLKKTMDSFYEDDYFPEDALFLERNSRDFISRAATIDENTLMVCELLRSKSIAGGAKDTCVKDIYYPKWSTPENYEVCRRKGTDNQRAGGYGGLFSVTFTCEAASKAFFDSLPCAKGPSLGTNFTLASPYVILAHYTELDWARSYDVDPGLVRVAVGMETPAVLTKWFNDSVAAAQAAAEAAAATKQ